MEYVAVYGFGSFFNGISKYRDIDLLILHQSTSYESCQFSIWCKYYFVNKLFSAHITILSRLEEYQFSFIERSRAKILGFVFADTAQMDLDIINQKIIKFTSIN